jgi:ubiquinone/menaquinone biosynthesis C-methylase UbiE
LSIFNALAPYYDSWYENDGKFIFETEVRAIQELIRPSQTGPCIEIGIGSGRFAERLEINYGIDPAIELLKIAGRKRINVVQGIGEFLPFKANCFSTVFIIATLSFVNSVPGVLYEANRILKNDGSLIVGFIPSTGSWGKVYKRKKEADHPFYRNATFYSYEQLETEMETTGFSVINIVSTLLQQPDEVNMVEQPEHGLLPESGFIIIHAEKMR